MYYLVREDILLKLQILLKETKYKEVSWKVDSVVDAKMKVLL